MNKNMRFLSLIPIPLFAKLRIRESNEARIAPDHEIAGKMARCCTPIIDTLTFALPKHLRGRKILIRTQSRARRGGRYETDNQKSKNL